jgi:uncharacterized alkaline shock family protein YloU
VSVLGGDGGTVTISPDALSQIVLGAAESVDGARVRKPKRRHLEVAVADGHARVELQLAIRLGAVIPDVARAVQQEVADALRAMCEVEVDSVDVTVEELD